MTFINGLEDYRSFKLEQKVDGDWVEIDQSYCGKDFWQTDSDPQTQRREITYSLALDTPNEKR